MVMLTSLFSWYTWVYPNLCLLTFTLQHKIDVTPYSLNYYEPSVNLLPSLNVNITTKTSISTNSGIRLNAFFSCFVLFSMSSLRIRREAWWNVLHFQYGWNSLGQIQSHCQSCTSPFLFSLAWGHMDNAYLVLCWHLGWTTICWLWIICEKLLWNFLFIQIHWKWPKHNLIHYHYVCGRLHFAIHNDSLVLHFNLSEGVQQWSETETVKILIWLSSRRQAESRYQNS